MSYTFKETNELIRTSFLFSEEKKEQYRKNNKV